MTSKPPEHPSATEASSIDTPTARLAELALDPILMPLIAANPATSAATLEQLASRQDERLNRAIAGNPNAPLPLLLELAKAFPQEFLTNPAFPFFMMTHPAFVRDISAEAWLSLLRCETIPPSWLCQLQDGRIPITTGHPEIHARMTRRERLDITRKYILDAVRNHVQTSGEIDEHGRSELDQALSISPRDDYQPALYDATTFIALATMTPPLALASIEHTLLAQQEHMKQLSYDDHKKFTELVDTVLTHCPGVTSDLLGRLAKNEDEDIQRIIARHPQTPVVTLEQLAHSSTGHIRWDIARNRNIPVDLFRRLMQDADPFIRHTTTSHPHATIHDLHTLAHDQDAMVRRGVAQLPQLPHDFYRWLAHDQDETVRACVAQNPHTPQMLLKMLAQDQQSDVRACAARNPCLPPETLATLSQEPVKRILTSLASNPQLPADLIRNLANNALLQDDLWILAENPQTPSDLLTRWAQTWAQSGDDQLLSLASNPQLPPAILAWLIPYILDDAEVYGDHNAD
ncbi:MAG: hypothetical protein J2P37_19555, partial [Ktedonobacteraceae bacterium]|nr:hypothetical protein [Ktedonobacteraceae bacterium]